MRVAHYLAWPLWRGAQWLAGRLIDYHFRVEVPAGWMRTGGWRYNLGMLLTRFQLWVGESSGIILRNPAANEGAPVFIEAPVAEHAVARRPVTRPISVKASP